MSKLEMNSTNFAMATVLRLVKALKANISYQLELKNQQIKFISKGN
jgi:hypothetical protein